MVWLRVAVWMACAAMGWAQSAGTAGAYPPVAWDVCVENEGKGGTCGAGGAPLAFAMWLQPGTWLKQKVDGFSYELEFDVSQVPKEPRWVTWKPVGLLAGRRVRRLDYHLGKGVPASMLVAERGTGLWSPLLQWYGAMPAALVFEAQGKQVLLVETDWGTRVPMTESWAWVNGPEGLVRVDAEGAMDEAMAKVDAGEYKRLAVGFQWKELRMNAAVWKGKFPGMGELEESVEGWFRWEGAGLALKSAERSRLVARWP